ncbi:hypothetical protein [Chryseobacterium indologenes]|uniref:hypothetical protein n=1 Tax=Chryseobacterium indologenes TaxID=253 RepID=UPI0030189C85
MEFKGTKGKWIKSLSKKNNIIVKSEDGFSLNLTFGKISEDDCTTANCCKKEEHANALLVSKSPEMLEMLKKARDKFIDLKHDNNLPELKDIQWEIEDLIKEATEI